MKNLVHMKNELSIKSFREIPVNEQQDINGGFWQVLVSLGILAVDEIIDDWDNFKNGLMGRPEEKNP